MNRIGSEFGWAPAARARLSIKGGKEKSLDELAKERAERNRAEWEKEKKRNHPA
jgi:phage terminase small subunit